jgi:glycosyltransferase involved in cell wall biosynthesis
VPPNYLLNLQEEDVILKYGLESKYIFYPAQFWEHKNHINLLKSIKILKERGLNVNLVLVGSQKNNYKKVLLQIKDLGISENVRILGYISNSELLSLYRNAVGMVFVSFLGPTNIPPMEAMVTGCPLICSDAYAMPEQVGSAGLLINPRDPLDIANKIEKIWNDAKLREELSKLGEEKSKEYGLVNLRLNLMEYINLAMGK